MPPPLYEHQKKGVALLQQHDVFGLLLEMGTGKTRIAIEDWIRREGYNLLVIAPKGVSRNWVGEIEKYTEPGTVDCVYWVSGGNKEDERNIQRILLPSSSRRVLLMNVEALSSVKAARQTVQQFVASGKTVCVVDESTRIKTWNSNRTREVLALTDKIRVKRILSGLIAPHSPLDLYSQFLFLDWRILGFTNYFSFRARYAIMKKMNFGGRKIETVVGYKNLDELQKKIAPYTYRVLKEECLDLPAKIYTERSVELSDQQRKAYNELKKYATTMLETGEYVSTGTAIALLTRLHQIICGHVRSDEDKVTEIDCHHRENELIEVLEECDGKAIVWADFRPTLARLSKILKEFYGEDKVVEFWGATSDKDREEAKRRFQEDPSCRIFLGNPSVGGIGLTLTAAKYVVYYSNSYNLEIRSQSEDRAHRAGLTHSVTYVDLVAKDTIDDKILTALRQKIDIASTLTGEKLREWIR